MGLIEDVAYRFLTQALAPRPEILKQGDQLVIRSGWRTWLLSLGARHRRIAVEPIAKVLRIKDRRFWLFFSSRRIEFDWIAQIYMDDVDLSVFKWGAYTQEDLVRVSLRLKDGSQVRLFTFYNQGDFVNNSVLWPDWMYWQEHAANEVVPGDQMSGVAARLGNVLSGLIGVPFV